MCFVLSNGCLHFFLTCGMIKQIYGFKEHFMISFVKGKAADMTETSVILENHGIGYEIFMTGNDLSRIHMGEEYKIHTYFQVREDAMVLFGFLQKVLCPACSPRRSSGKKPQMQEEASKRRTIRQVC